MYYITSIDLTLVNLPYSNGNDYRRFGLRYYSMKRMNSRLIQTATFTNFLKLLATTVHDTLQKIQTTRK